MFEPEFERCFFRNSGFLPKLLGPIELDDRQKALVEYAPKRVLREILPDYQNELSKRLINMNLLPLADDPAIAQVVGFLKAAFARAEAA